MSFFFFVTHTPVHQSDLTTQNPHLENPWSVPCLGFPRAASVSLLLAGTNHITTSNSAPAVSQACPRISLSPLNRCPPPSWLWWWDRLVPYFSTEQLVPIHCWQCRTRSPPLYHCLLNTHLPGTPEGGHILEEQRKVPVFVNPMDPPILTHDTCGMIALVLVGLNAPAAPPAPSHCCPCLLPHLEQSQPQIGEGAEAGRLHWPQASTSLIG